MNRDENAAARDGHARKLGSRKLVLHKETLRKLEAGELRQVVAGAITNGERWAKSHPQRGCATIDGC